MIIKKWAMGTALAVSMLPTVASAGLVTLDLLTDDFGGETSFDMISDPGGASTPVAFDTHTPAQANLADGFAGTNELANATSYMFTWDLAPGDYDFTISDSFGDGICCTFGNGGFTLTTPDGAIPSPSGGEFGSSETIGFSITNPVPVPGTLALMGLGILSALSFTRRARKNKK